MSDARERLEYLGELAHAARDEADVHRRAQQLARLQRLSGWALRDAVDELQDADVGFREIGPLIGLPWQTLWAQHDKGGRIVVREITGDDELERGQ